MLPEVSSAHRRRRLTATLFRAVDLLFDAVERSWGPLEELYCVNYV